MHQSRDHLLYLTVVIEHHEIFHHPDENGGGRGEGGSGKGGKREKKRREKRGRKDKRLVETTEIDMVSEKSGNYALDSHSGAGRGPVLLSCESLR